MDNGYGLNDFIVFETDRMFIREFNMDDAGAVFSYYDTLDDVMCFDDIPRTRNDARNLVIYRLGQQIAEPRRMYAFAVCLKASGRLIGELGLFIDETGEQGELGYIFHSDYRGMGCASEAAEGMLRFGFTALDLHRIYAKCDSENLASEGVLRRSGMRFEGESRSSLPVTVRGRREWRSIKHFAILRKEYLNGLFELQGH